MCKLDHLTNTTDHVVDLQEPGREQWKERVGQQRQEAAATADKQERNLSDLAKEGVSQRSSHLQGTSLIHCASVVSQC